MALTRWLYGGKVWVPEGNERLPHDCPRDSLNGDIYVLEKDMDEYKRKRRMTKATKAPALTANRTITDEPDGIFRTKGSSIDCSLCGKIIMVNPGFIAVAHGPFELHCRDCWYHDEAEGGPYRSPGGPVFARPRAPAPPALLPRTQGALTPARKAILAGHVIQTLSWVAMALYAFNKC